MHHRIIAIIQTLPVAALVISTGCSSSPYELDLMGAPAVFENGAIDPFPDDSPIELPRSTIPYATLRQSVTEDDRQSFYRNARGQVLRVGMAHVEVGAEGVTWEEARRISLLKSRPDRYPIKVTGADEMGVLERSSTVFTDRSLLSEDPSVPGAMFAAAIDEKLAESDGNDIYIYVHGFRVVFENPVLVATELWHFMGYRGVFVSFSWPSTPRSLGYFRDTETAAWSALGFRKFLEYLAEKTSAERIHIVGYSAGTRLVTRTLEQLALLHRDMSTEAIREHLRIGQVILIGSDVDRQLLGGYIVDGILRVTEHLTIYKSSADSALGMAQWVFRMERAGQAWDQDSVRPEITEFLLGAENLSFINVTEAANATAGNGHGYFRSSPWVSSDVLATLAFGLGPGERGLIRPEGSPTWYFPADYLERLRTAMERIDPGLAD